MLTRWLLAVCWVAVTLLVTAVLFFGNFVVAWQAFVLMGFEPEPLSAIPLLGPIATAAGVGGAQLAALYAAVLTAAMAVIVISACKYANDLLTLCFDVRQARLVGTVNPIAAIKLYETATAFGVALVLAVIVARYDVSLFSLRLEALVTGVDDIKESINWVPDAATRLGAYLADFAAHARWGYLGVIAGVAFTTEKAFQRAAERWLVLGQTLDAAILGPEAPPSVAGDNSAPTATDDSPRETTSPADMPFSGPTPAAGPGVAEPSGPEGDRSRPVQPGPVPPGRGPTDSGSTPPPRRGPMVRVICGPGVTRELPLQDVERNPEYVRDGAGREWFLKTYYDELTAERRQADAQPEENRDRQSNEEHSHV